MLDRRLRARIDPADIVQDALLHVAIRLPDYIQDRPTAFFPWLKSIVENELIRAHRHHLVAQRRSVLREHELGWYALDIFRQQPVDQIPGSDPSPSQQAMIHEQKARMRQILQRLPIREREILTMRYDQQLKIREIASQLKISPPAVRSRLQRAKKAASQWPALYEPQGHDSRKSLSMDGGQDTMPKGFQDEETSEKKGNRFGSKLRHTPTPGPKQERHLDQASSAVTVEEVTVG